MVKRKIFSIDSTEKVWYRYISSFVNCFVFNCSEVKRLPRNKSELQLFMQLGGRLFEQLLDETAAKWQLSPSEIQILLFLDQMPHLDTARDVAQHCGMSKASVSGNVLKLATRGLLTVDVDLKDRRFQHLTLTEQVTPIIADTRELLQRFDAQLLKALTDEEREQFLSLLSKINAADSSSSL